jgi:hypothetical protein
MKHIYAIIAVACITAVISIGSLCVGFIVNANLKAAVDNRVRQDILHVIESVDYPEDKIIVTYECYFLCAPETMTPNSFRVPISAKAADEHYKLVSCTLDSVSTHHVHGRLHIPLWDGKGLNIASVEGDVWYMADEKISITITDVVLEEIPGDPDPEEPDVIVLDDGDTPSKGLSPAAIGGIVAGVTAVLGTSACVAIYFARRKRA